MRRGFLMIAVGAVAACTGERARGSLRGGETRAEVEALMGGADGYRREGNTEALTYSNRLTRVGFEGNFHVILTDGRVSTYGTGDLRQGNGGVLVLVPRR